ncbi:hypothetical protein ACFP3T_07695 [Lactiplantibacillus dongliensis]|uniref:Extracellular protein n=1 Tax=Lactiplantibacillus dongliensis TaxID=2559919 RepID=A0ABW1R3W4_9LACO|nr:hypothetical protein [Lactiplantibacillus dongliensis]
MKQSRILLGALVLSLGSSLAMGPITANAASTTPYQAHLRLRLKARKPKSRLKAHAQTKKTTTKKATVTTYGKLSQANKKKFKIALSDQKKPLTATSKFDKKTKKIVTNYTYSLKLTNKTKKAVKFYFSNLRYNVYDLTNKTVPAKNVKPVATAAHVTLKAGASKTVKQAVSMNPMAFNNKTDHERIAFFTYGNLANNKAMMATVTLAKNSK